MSELTIHLDEVDPIRFFGANNARLDLMKEAFPRLRIGARGNTLNIKGNQEDITEFKTKLSEYLDYLLKNGSIPDQKLRSFFLDEVPVQTNGSKDPKDIILHANGGNVIRARTANQRVMVEQSRKNDIVFAVGPAGTGKTYTAVALAVKALKEKVVRRIILTRPAVEAGESLGFLPGDLKEKIDPYLRPLYDALDDMIPPEKLRYYMENRVIEVAPLAFMRGRTLDKAFIILDEAQNCTSLQLKMFLTRIGPSAKAIITGDLTQVDLPKSQKSGLGQAFRTLGKIDGIGQVQLTKEDVIRHRLVKKIIEAYERMESPKED